MIESRHQLALAGAVADPTRFQVEAGKIAVAGMEQHHPRPHRRRRQDRSRLPADRCRSATPRSWQATKTPAHFRASPCGPARAVASGVTSSSVSATETVNASSATTSSGASSVGWRTISRLFVGSPVVGGGGSAGCGCDGATGAGAASIFGRRRSGGFIGRAGSNGYPIVAGRGGSRIVISATASQLRVPASQAV